MKSLQANLLEIESTQIDNYAGDTTGKSIIATASGSADKGETAQVFGQPGLITNPSKNNIGLRLSKGSLDIIIGTMNYLIPLPENNGETLLYSTDADGVLKSSILLDNVGNIKMNSQAGKLGFKNNADDLFTILSELITEISAIATFGSPTNHVLKPDTIAKFTVLNTRLSTIMEAQ